MHRSGRAKKNLLSAVFAGLSAKAGLAVQVVVLACLELMVLEVEGLKVAAAVAVAAASAVVA